MFDDLREYLKRAGELGDSKVIKGADWNQEIGVITELSGNSPDRPLLIFDEIKGYPPGYRVVTNFFNNYKLFNLAYDLPLEARGVELVKAWRTKFKGKYEPVPPRQVRNGPVLENVLTGKDVDLWQFPTPKWHDQDGGRYIGTADMVVTRDPEDGWVNVGTYRVQIHDKTTANIHISPGHHGGLIREKYWAKGQSCPAAVVCGGEPGLWGVSMSAINMPEYEYAGWLRGKPVDVIRGKTVDLPIPATAEIVLEGEMVPPGVDDRLEGPHGESQGYYTGGARLESVFKVTGILHRNNPIILGAPTLVMDYDTQACWFLQNTIYLWEELTKQVPNVQGVWVFTEARTQFTVVSIKQAYDGHAAETAMAVAGTYAGTFRSRFIIIVDEDIDPSNISQVLWAVGTRCDPAQHIDIIRGFRAIPSDAILSPEQRRINDYTTSKCVIYAVRPYWWKDKFPPPVRSTPDVLAAAQKKWGNILFGK
jgi:4-hydroxy-3-polyprenylbenzoate decarboxylase